MQKRALIGVAVDANLRFFDITRFPLVIARAPSGTSAASDIQPFYAEWDIIFRSGRHAALVDLTGVDAVLVGAAERKQIAAAIEQRRANFEKHLFAEARLCGSPQVRGLLTALDWLMPRALPHPIRYYTKRSEAEAWLLSELQHTPMP